MVATMRHAPCCRVPRARGRAPLVAAGLALLVAAGGCGGGSGDSLPRHAVYGKVTLDGKPLEQGVISFTPDAQGASPVTGGGVISAGSYSIPRDQGLTPGKYKVAITASDAPIALAAGEAPGAPPRAKTKAKPEPVIPAKYNAKSTLEREVKADGSNTFDFELTSK
jgi:hypothetical protein